jgi:hypothetical protein
VQRFLLPRCHGCGFWLIVPGWNFGQISKYLKIDHRFPPFDAVFVRQVPVSPKHIFGIDRHCSRLVMAKAAITSGHKVWPQIIAIHPAARSFQRRRIMPVHLMHRRDENWAVFAQW